MPPFSIRKLAPVVGICIGFSTCPSNAMNWEGHDDWMADLPPAIALQSATTAATLPPRPSDVCRVEVPRNPYEQIPLATDMCHRGSPATGKVRPGAKP